MFAKLVVLLAFAAVGDATTSLKHCRTRYDEPSRSTALICENLYDEMTLYDDLRRAKDSTELLVQDSSLRFFAHGTFHGTKIKGITIKNSYLLGFTNTDVAFDGLQYSLFGVYLQNCTFVDHLDLTQLKEMKSLGFIAVRGSDLEYIPDLSALSDNPVLTFLDMPDNQVSDIHPRAFSQLSHLTYVRLTNNRIQSITRSMFPILGIVYLDISRNLLTAIPDDMFSNMPNLRTVVLCHNRLTTITEKVFGGVVNQLSVLELDNNPVSCDCRLRWITSLHLKFIKMQVICDSPLSLKGRLLVELEGSDLWC